MDDPQMSTGRVPSAYLQKEARAPRTVRQSTTVNERGSIRFRLAVGHRTCNAPPRGALSTCGKPDGIQQGTRARLRFLTLPPPFRCAYSSSGASLAPCGTPARAAQQTTSGGHFDFVRSSARRRPTWARSTCRRADEIKKTTHICFTSLLLHRPMERASTGTQTGRCTA